LLGVQEVPSSNLGGPTKFLNSDTDDFDSHGEIDVANLSM